MNKQMKRNYERYLQSTDYELDDVYKSCSQAKRRAWRYCEELCYRLHGSNLKVVSHNCMIFTAGFEFDHPDTGVLMYMHITPSHDTAVEVEVEVEGGD